MIRTKTKPDSLSTLIKKLDDIFSDYIRLRDCDASGTVTCFVVGTRHWWKDTDAAHLFPRQHMGTRYDEQNVHAVSVYSNRFDKYHQRKYEYWFVAKYGGDQLEALEARSRSLAKLTRGELHDKIDFYKEKVATLKRQKGL